jgi:FHS family L-fucose permease-like MFS transporter
MLIFSSWLHEADYRESHRPAWAGPISNPRGHEQALPIHAGRAFNIDRLRLNARFEHTHQLNSKKAHMAIESKPIGQMQSSSQQGSGQSYRGPFTIMTILFFMWGFMTVWNDVLIPRFKEAFTLNYFQAMLVQFAFFGAYATGGILYYVISMFSGDPINRLGYKNGVIIGLIIAAGGSALFYPAALLTSYPFFLLALFIVGVGFALLQIAANPYVTILGPERTASSRLNLSQGFNSIGTTIGPILGGWLIFNVFTHRGAHGADSVKIPYLGFAAVFAMLAIFFKFAHLPNFTNPEQIGHGAGAMKHPHTVLGMIAIFMYVGGEVTVGSVIVNFLGLAKLGGVPHETAASYLAFYWGGLMIGRFMGAFSLSDMKSSLKNSLVVLVPVSAFCIILALPSIANTLHLDWPRAAELCSTANALHYGILLLVLMIAFFFGESSPHRMLALFSGVIIALLATGMLTAGETAKWAILGVGLFCSVMWSNIFSLAIEGLGPLKSQASSLLVIAILGGAVLPPTQGKLADLFGIQFSFIVPMIAFAYVGFYGLYGYRAGRQSS